MMSAKGSEPVVLSRPVLTPVSVFAQLSRRILTLARMSSPIASTFAVHGWFLFMFSLFHFRAFFRLQLVKTHIDFACGCGGRTGRGIEANARGPCDDLRQGVALLDGRRRNEFV